MSRDRSSFDGLGSFALGVVIVLGLLRLHERLPLVSRTLWFALWSYPTWVLVEEFQKQLETKSWEEANAIWVSLFLLAWLWMVAGLLLQLRLSFEWLKTCISPRQ